MIRLSLLCLCLGITLYSFAQKNDFQTIQGRVIDANTKENLAYASVFVMGTNKGTSTNAAGGFILKIPYQYQQDSFVVSYIGYLTKILPVKIENKTIIIELTPNTAQLQEVVVRPPDVLALVEAAFEKIPKNYELDDFSNTAFFRERLFANNQTIKIGEAYFEVYGRKYNKVANIIKGRSAEDKKQINQNWSPSFGDSAPTWGFAPHPLFFLESSPKKNTGLGDYYEFKWPKSIYIDGKEVMIITFDQKPKLKKSLLKGTFYIERESLAFLSIEISLSDQGKRFLKTNKSWNGSKSGQFPFSIDLVENKIRMDYQNIGSKWYLKTATMDVSFNVKHKFLFYNGGSKRLRLLSERVITTVDPTVSSTKVDSMLQLHKKENRNVFLEVLAEDYRDDFWENYNYIKPDTAISVIIERFEQNNEAYKKEKKQLALEQYSKSKRELTFKDLRKDLAYFKIMMETLHPGLYWYLNKDDWEQIFRKSEQSLVGITSEAQFFKLLSGIIEQVNCGHTDILPPKSKEEYMQFYTSFFPGKVKIFEDKILLKAKDQTLIETISINNQPIHQIVNELSNYISTDGFNETYKNFIIEKEFAQLYALYFGQPESFEVSGKNLEGKEVNLQLEGVSLESINKKLSSTFYDLRIQNGIAVLIIKSFIDAPKQEDFRQFLNHTFTQLKESGIEHLIIDLRNNQGGNDAYGALLYSYLSDQPFKYVNELEVASNDKDMLKQLYFDNINLMEAVPAFSSNIQSKENKLIYIDHPNLGLQQSQPNAFKGKVYVLINEGVFSTASDFAAIAKSNKRAVFIGQETGGGYYGNCSFGTPTFTLPKSEIRIQIPLAKYEMAVTKDQEKGRGVIPDFEEHNSLEDNLKGVDRAMQKALILIRNGK